MKSWILPLILCASVAASDNDPFGHALIPDMVADASIIDIDGTFYCFATTDGMGQHLRTAGMPVVWKSQNFLDWSFQGSIYPDDFDAKYWAPSVPVLLNGRWHSYPTLDGCIVAAVAPDLTGPFTAPDGSHITRQNLAKFPIEQKSSIDAEVFIDDDGQAWMVWSRRRIVKLKPDLLAPDGRQAAIATKRPGYSEGPILFKRKGIYYYLYTLGGGENYQYAYMMSRVSPLGPWEAPEQDIITTSDAALGTHGPGHGTCFHPQGSDQWYFVYLEYGRGSTNRQIFADRMDFNPDGTIRPVVLTKTGVGAIRPQGTAPTNLALGASASASSVRPDDQMTKPMVRRENHAAAQAIDGSNGTRWLAADRDPQPWWRIDLGAVKTISRTEAYFVRPTVGHAYVLEHSLDGATWLPYGGHDQIIKQSPHVDTRTVQARHLRLTVLKGTSGLWEFRVH